MPDLFVSLYVYVLRTNELSFTFKYHNSVKWAARKSVERLNVFMSVDFLTESEKAVRYFYLDVKYQ